MKDKIEKNNSKIITQTQIITSKQDNASVKVPTIQRQKLCPGKCQQNQSLATSIKMILAINSIISMTSQMGNP
jgi:hypothetical protein